MSRAITRPDPSGFRAKLIEELCTISAIEARDAEEAAHKERMLREVSAFLDGLRAQGEDPCR